MNKGGFLILFFVLTFTGFKPLSAKEISVGVAAISPTGLTAKFWLSKEHAIDVFGSWSFSSSDFNFHADYLLHNFDLIKIDENPLAFYYGLGVRIKDEEKEDTILGLRMPFGISYLMSNIPLDLYGEVAPRINVIPSTNFGLDVMIGVRFRFFSQNHQVAVQTPEYEE